MTTPSSLAQTDEWCPPLRTVRQAQGLMLRGLARRTGIDPGQLSKMEHGQAGLSVAALYRLATELGLHHLVRALRPYTRERA